VDVGVAADRDRLEHARHRRRGAHREARIAAPEQDRLAVLEVGGDAAEWNLELFDRGVVHRLVDVGLQRFALEHAGRLAKERQGRARRRRPAPARRGPCAAGSGQERGPARRRWRPAWSARNRSRPPARRQARTAWNVGIPWAKALSGLKWELYPVRARARRST